MLILGILFLFAAKQNGDELGRTRSGSGSSAVPVDLPLPGILHTTVTEYAGKCIY